MNLFLILIVIAPENLEKVLEFLSEYSAEIYVRDIILETDDKEYLESPDQ